MSSVINPSGGYLKAARVIYLDMRFRALIAGVNTLEVPWSDKRFDEYHSPEEKESTQSWQFTWKNLRQKRNICSQIGAIPSQRILQEACFRIALCCDRIVSCPAGSFGKWSSLSSTRPPRGSAGGCAC